MHFVNRGGGAGRETAPGVMLTLPLSHRALAAHILPPGEFLKLPLHGNVRSATEQKIRPLGARAGQGLSVSAALRRLQARRLLAHASGAGLRAQKSASLEAGRVHAAVLRIKDLVFHS